jgi:N-acetylneuraminate lyase
MRLSEFNRLTGLIAATHTPFHADATLNLSIVEKQAAHLLSNGVQTAFIGGTTGESHSLTLDERRALAQRWMEVTRGSKLRAVMHVGSNCLLDAAVLARQAQELGAAAVSALAPSYFKPHTVTALVDCCTQIAGAAPDTPFYFYDIPSMTGVHLPMPEFLAEARARVPNLAGLKFTNPDLKSYQLCLNAESHAFDCPWGIDEALLGALAVGARGAVGSTYNFAAPIYHRLMTAFAKGDWVIARAEQLRSVRLVQTLSAHGYMGAARAVMRILGVDVGPARLPNTSLSAAQAATLRRELELLGFFDWIRPTYNAVTK